MHIHMLQPSLRLVLRGLVLLGLFWLIAQMPATPPAAGAAPAPPVSSTGIQPDTRPAAPTTGRTITFSYDTAGRLMQVNYGGKRNTFVYDNAGNLLQEGETSVPYLYLPMLAK